jgi:hypothetical protein
MLYNAMLRRHREGTLGRGPGKVTKATMIRDFGRDFAPTRSRQSIEFKLRNVSAARVALGLAWLPGFVPATNASNDIAAAIAPTAAGDVNGGAA